MEIVFIIGSMQAVLFFFLIIRKKDKILPDKVLAVFFLLIAFHLLLRYIFSSGFLQEFPHLLGVHTGLPLLYGPLLYFYVVSLTKKNQKFLLTHLLHFVPFFAVIIFLIPFYSQPADIKLSIINGEINFPEQYVFIIIMQLLSGPIYIVWTLILLKNHKENIGLYFSNIEMIELRWLKNLTIGLAGIWIVILLVYAVWEISNIPVPFEKEIVIYSAVTVFIFVIGYKGLTQSTVFLSDINIDFEEAKEIQPQKNNKLIHPTDPMESSPNSKESLRKSTDEKSQNNVNNLLQYMKEKKPYLEYNLTLSHVAVAIDIPPYKLTKIFNENLQQNFFNFVNSYRVEEVKRRLLDPKNKQFTILALANDCGFSSKASFNRIFKQMTNTTPSAYQKINRIESDKRL